MTAGESQSFPFVKEQNNVKQYTLATKQDTSFLLCSDVHYFLLYVFCNEHHYMVVNAVMFTTKFVVTITTQK